MKKLNHNLTKEPKKRILISDRKFYYRLQLLKQTRMEIQDILEKKNEQFL